MLLGHLLTVLFLKAKVINQMTKIRVAIINTMAKMKEKNLKPLFVSLSCLDSESLSSKY